MNPVRVLTGRRILLGVSGSIAAFKAAQTASLLTQGGALVDVVTTPAARRFVGLPTFAGLTGRPAYDDVAAMSPSGAIAHVELGLAAEAALVAPATANTIAQLAAGGAANVLTAALLSVKGPRLLAPAMEANMLTNPAQQANLMKLRKAGWMVIEPEWGRHASGRTGVGRMPDPQRLVDRLRAALGASGPLAGRNVVVSAGGTREFIDPVRFLGNPSTGAQGVAIAEAARDRGANVTLVAANLAVRAPAGLKTIAVVDAAEMAAAIEAVTPGSDALIMAAAVGDFQPTAPSDRKLPRRDGLALSLVPTPDILAGARKARVRIGFALSTGDLAESALRKLQSKQLDAVVGNDLDDHQAGFGVGSNIVSIYTAAGIWDQVGPAPKSQVAERVIDLLQELFS